MTVRHRRFAALRVERTPGPFRRSSTDRAIGGVAGGLSSRLGIDVTVVRLGLVVLVLANGVGVAAYLLAWLLLPSSDGGPALWSRARSDAKGIALALALAPLLIVGLVLGSALHVGWLGSAVWPIFIGAGALVLIWRNSPADERELLRNLAAPLLRVDVGAPRSWRNLAMRAGVGACLIAAAVAVLIFGNHHAFYRPVVGVALVIVALFVIFGPWWLAVARELVEERQARIRAEERADMATRVHDSVLQTLAMIQAHANDPQQVVGLARSQERELRAWLFEGRPPGTPRDGEETLVAGIRAIQRDVEARHNVPVEIVTVGDAPLDDNLLALLAAGREATTNAAKWSQASVISLYLEVDGPSVALFVRDRGVGFDLTTVPSDRRGVVESIRGRMARHGGTASIRTAPGRGTEVELRMSRAIVRSGESRGPT